MRRCQQQKTLSFLAALFLLGGGGLFLWRTGFFAATDSLEEMRAYIGAFSPYSQMAFFVIQLLSVILAPIPSNITAAAGAVVFGLWPSFALTMGAVLVGSVTVFLLARMLGQPFAERFVPSEVAGNYLSVLRAKRDVVLFLVFLFPLFPDDLICILAGLTDIPAPRFAVILILTRPWGLLVASAVGSSAIAVSLRQMILIGAVGIVLFVLIFRYGDRWERRLLEYFGR